MSIRILTGDCRDLLKTLPDTSVHCVVTSPPYFGLRDYGTVGQIGLEPTPRQYVGELVAIFREVRRVLRDDGTLWLNLGDSYASGGGIGGPQRNNNGGFSGSDGQRTQDYANASSGFNRPSSIGDGLKAKDLIGIPWRVAFALQADGWYLRQDIIWSKPNPMPESVTDRCTKAHEYIFLLSKNARYYYDADAIAEAAEEGRGLFRGGYHRKGLDGSRNDGSRQDLSVALTRNKRSVWEIATQPYSEAHFATFPPALIEPCVLAGCPVGGTVLDPFAGAGTTGLVADRLNRNAILIELNAEYATMTERRIKDDAGMFAEVQ